VPDDYNQHRIAAVTAGRSAVSVTPSRFNVNLSLETCPPPTPTPPAAVEDPIPGASCVLWPLRFAATIHYVEVKTGTTTETLSGNFTVDRNYWMAGDDQTDTATDGGTGDLVVWFEQLLNSHTDGGAGVYTVSVSADGILTVAIDSGDFEIYWTHANTDLDPTVFGFAAADVASASSTLSAPSRTQGIWAPGVPYSIDDRDRQPYVGARRRSASGLQRTSYVAAPKKRRPVFWDLINKKKALSEYVDTDDLTGDFESLEAELALGRRVRLYDDASTRTGSSYALYRCGRRKLDRSDKSKILWRVDLELTRGED